MHFHKIITCRYADMGIESAILMFENYKKVNGFSGKFEDDLWIGIGYLQLDRMLFKFNDIKVQYRLALKCWTIVRLSEGCMDNVLNELNKLKRLLVITNGFKKERFDNLIEYIFECRTPKNKLRKIIIGFCEFSSIGDYEYYVKGLKIIPMESRKSSCRKIVDWHTMLEFDYIFSDFFKMANEGDIRKYYPLLLWWEFSRVIPMRPSEMCLILKNPLRYDKENGIYYISIPTIKQKSWDERILYSEIAITKDMYDLFLEYLALVEYDDDRKYIFSYKERNKYIKNDRYIEEDRDFFTSNNLSDLLDSFLVNVVGKIYKKKNIRKGAMKEDSYMEMIDLGDTRHMAFYNMISLGYGPYVVMEMARHDSINSQMFYYAHLDVFMESKVKIMADKIKLKILSKENIYNANLDQFGNYFAYRDAILQIMGKRSDGEDLIDIEGAFCEKRHYLIDCPPKGTCLNCPHHIGEEGDGDAIAIHLVTEEYERSKNDIDLAINTMLGYFKDNLYRQKETCFKEQAQKMEGALYRTALAKAKIDIWEENKR